MLVVLSQFLLSASPADVVLFKAHCRWQGNPNEEAVLKLYLDAAQQHTLEVYGWLFGVGKISRSAEERIGYKPASLTQEQIDAGWCIENGILKGTEPGPIDVQIGNGWTSPIVDMPRIKLAILQLATHYYEQRQGLGPEVRTQYDASDEPRGVRWILQGPNGVG